ncbi:MAG: lipid-A-disaccharide synthase [Planctomycetaceae bacterium]|jgi:lipid-A-disaccharide synthase|nr:lipid-A-disaccharide synthase [Planctomycetaceae bacterium]
MEGSFSNPLDCSMKFFFSAGEPSGDIHAAALIETIKAHAPESEFVGFGSTRMEQAGCRLIADMNQFAVMWVWHVVKTYFRFRKLLAEAKQVLQSEDIDAVVLIDYPGFNWHVAKAAKKLGIPVVYFMPPQVWAWAQYRVKKMRRLVNLVLCALLFEWQWFRRRGCQAVFIGHPFFEEIRKKQSDPEFLEKFYSLYGHAPILTLLAGSRKQEIQANLPDMLSAVQRVQYEVTNVQPVFAAFSDEHATMIQQHLTERNMSIPVFAGRTTELIRAADCCLAVSGSVSMELLASNKPSVIYYRVGGFGLFIQRFFRRTRYITLVNLLGASQQKGQSVFYDDSIRVIPKEPSAEDRHRMFFPEFLTSTDRSADVADWLIRWLSQPESLAFHKQHLDSLFRAVDTVESPLELATEALLAREFDSD